MSQKSCHKSYVAKALQYRLHALAKILTLAFSIQVFQTHWQVLA